MDRKKERGFFLLSSRDEIITAFFYPIEKETDVLRKDGKYG